MEQGHSIPAAPWARTCGVVLSPGGDEALYRALLRCAREPGDLATLAFAGVIAMAGARKLPYDVPIHGVTPRELDDLRATIFPHAAPHTVTARQRAGEAVASLRDDEFDDLVQLLEEHATRPGRVSQWLARALATASLGDNHLWQDMGLPSRRTLSRLMEEHFAALHTLNVGNMRWKKFFYRQLCERADIPICKAPSCAVCVDMPGCFPDDPLTPAGDFPQASG